MKKTKLSTPMKKSPHDFSELLKDVKSRIQQAQARSIQSVNSELIRLYWDVGRIIDQRQKKEGWGSYVIPKLAKELSGELTELKGFSERNLGRMIAFYRTYSDVSAILPPTVAKLGLDEKPQLESIFWGIPWAHHILLMEQIKEYDIRFNLRPTNDKANQLLTFKDYFLHPNRILFNKN